ncbi:unnamed protein product [Ceutorhynchus assimilis]|uniref:Mutator-like transposase domain-containing protein n=1 Tax=Ceutorhynchus assimilis TaxID=467358 RepID=A0A9P0DU94_9CUCU|nr:unnamed protein product [Ceutorhynchus assimilis]CAH1183559.1 unnamed protein product [Ceutorhynchus assimilis]
MDKKQEPFYRRGNKTVLRLSTRRRKRTTFPKKKGDMNSVMGTETNPLPSTDCLDAAAICSTVSHVSNDNNEIDFELDCSATPSTSQTESLKSCNSPINPEGRRVVDLQFFISELVKFSGHSPQFGCSLENMKILKEERKGLLSILHVTCNMCNEKFEIPTSKVTDDNVNNNAVLGIMSIGSGFAHLQQICTSLDIPCLSEKLYSSVHENICDLWEETAVKYMKEAAEEERALAIANGDQNQLRLRWAIDKAIKHWKNKNDLTLSEKIVKLKRDIENSTSHVFGEHKECKSIGYFCEKPFDQGECALKDLKLTDLYDKLCSFKNYLIRHASSLIHDVDNNSVEQFNSIIAKFIGGKRINYCRRRSYQSRCAAAVVSHNTKMPIYTLRKQLNKGSTPSKLSKKLEFCRMRKNSRALRKCAKKLFTKKISKADDGSESYGIACQKPDMDETEYTEAKDRF